MTFKEFKDRFEHKRVLRYGSAERSAKPLVSVCVHTYQHEKFIGECLEGIVNQQTSFDFEILVGEDESSDRTREICQEYADNYPGKIRLFLHHRSNNIRIAGMATGRFNFLYNIFQARGEYVALCEGDDYWVDKHKLQTQVDFLESNKDYSMSFGNANIEDLTDSYHRSGLYLANAESRTVEYAELVGIGVPTLTNLFRFNVDIPEWYMNVVSADKFLILLLSQHGKVYYHNKIFGVHRKHSSGFSRMANRLAWYENTAKYMSFFAKEARRCQKGPLMLESMRARIYAFFLSIQEKGFLKSVSMLYGILFSGSFYRRPSLGLFRKLCMRLFDQRKTQIDTF